MSPAKKSARRHPNPKPAAKKSTATNTAHRESAKETGGAPRDEAIAPRWAQAGDRLTTSAGVGVPDTDNSLKAGARGPSLLEDHHLREKITHFDHERIPERVVHARGAGAHGTFVLEDSLADVTCARFLTETGVAVPTFVRFSTVAGSRGSADTARDVRGFATRFYTDEGNVDLVGNNIPVFFIQDGIKFPDIIHAVKPEPDREIPQAQSAHDTFWDFASLQPETTHMLMWVMSDRAIPRSYRTMEGFGVHTFRLVNEAGQSTLAKFHWKPAAGIHGLAWDEAQKINGVDPDFHRRDLWNSIETGNFPEWELGVQLMPDTDDETFEGIDLLDPTKIVPEELVPVRLVGRMTLNRNPVNYFAETEQVAFHPGNLVRGIDFTNDPLLQARLFSYVDTQLTRLGGPNFNQLPINRSHAEVNDNLRDGFSQQAIHEGRAPYAPNSVGGGCPYAADPGAFVHVPRHVEGDVVRVRPVSFDDHFTQATLFWNSMSDAEREHIVAAFSFELGNVESEEIQARMLANLADVDADLCAQVADNLGQPVPTGSPLADAGASAALTMLPDEPGAIEGRVIGVLVDDAPNLKALRTLAARLSEEGAVLNVVAPKGGKLAKDMPVHKTYLTAQSVQFDALVVLIDDPAFFAANPKAAVMVHEAYRHFKPIAVASSAHDPVLDALGMPEQSPGLSWAEGVDLGFLDGLVEDVGWHRFWERDLATIDSPVG